MIEHQKPPPDGRHVMDTAVCLVPEPNLVAIPAFEGQSLPNALEDLDVLAEQLQLEPLSSFLHLSSDEMEHVTFSLIDFLMPKTEWFAAENLLETVFALRVHLEKHPQVISSAEQVLADLVALEMALEVCENHHIRVRLTIDTYSGFHIR